MQYDERSILLQYIWNHYRHLLTLFERLVETAGVVRQKAQASNSPNYSRMLNDRWGSLDNSSVDAALKDGLNAFKQRVCERILAEHGDQVFVNRCSQCHRIVRTPQARQCFWCGYNWHHV